MTTDDRKTSQEYPNSDEYESYHDWASVIPVPDVNFLNPYPNEKDYSPQSVYQLMAEQAGTNATDMQIVNEQIDKLRIGMYSLYQHVQTAERKLARAKSRYEMTYNRIYLETDDVKTDSQRRAVTDIKCEKLKNRVEVCDAIVKDLRSRSRLMANDLDALKTLSYNMRKEIQ